jgi:hypothetical protein
LVRRLLLIAAAVALVWRIGSSGMSAHYAERVRQGDAGAAGNALTWDGRRPEALLAQAKALRETDTDNALRLLAQAYRGNPADSRALITSARILLERGETDRADALVEAAVSIMPADPRIQRQATGYWLTRGDLSRGLRHASLAMETNPAAKDQFFSLLLKVAENPATRPALQPFAVSSPAWWEPFFAQVASRALDIETVRELYALRSEASAVPVSEPERRAYVERLMKDGQIAEAYVAWVNGLSPAQRAHLGLVHDGGFELEPSNWGFDWRIRGSRTARVEPARTFGADRERALHLRFDRHEGQFQNVAQTLFLDPARYRLTGRVRTDSLETKGGLKWVVRCLLPDPALLGESERFLGVNEWRDFAIEFDVPGTCTLQELRLVSAGNRAFEHQMNGSTWFDRMAIRRLPSTSGP